MFLLILRVVFYCQVDRVIFDELPHSLILILLENKLATSIHFFTLKNKLIQPAFIFTIPFPNFQNIS